MDTSIYPKLFFCTLLAWSWPFVYTPKHVAIQSHNILKGLVVTDGCCPHFCIPRYIRHNWMFPLKIYNIHFHSFFSCGKNKETKYSKSNGSCHIPHHHILSFSMNSRSYVGWCINLWERNTASVVRRPLLMWNLITHAVIPLGFHVGISQEYEWVWPFGGPCVWMTPNMTA